MNRLITHVRSNAIAYVALFFAIGGGGAGAAIAATVVSTNTIHACVSKTNGALYVAKRCTSAERALSFDQRGPAGPAGSAASLPYGQVDDAGVVTAEKGMTITPTATGKYTVTITASNCAKSTAQIPAITPIGIGGEPGAEGYTPPPGGNVQPVLIDGGPDGHGFTIETGYISNGTFVLTPQAFNVIDECGNYSS